MMSTELPLPPEVCLGAYLLGGKGKGGKEASFISLALFFSGKHL